jgi:translation initiation factor 1
MNSGRKIFPDGGADLAQNPFGALRNVAGVADPGPTVPSKTLSPPGSSADAGLWRDKATPATAKPQKNRGRVDLTRETGGRGGKTVTVISGFVGIGLPEKEALAKKMRAACGCGGTVKDGTIVIQGDQRDTLARILLEAGFRPVLAGG